MKFATLWYTFAVSKEYEQYCPMALGLERIGERWTLLIVRDLLFGPMRYSDLKASLPGIATNMLANRLTEMQGAGIISKREMPPPAASTVYELTELGRGLVPVLVELGRWGMKFLPEHGFDNLDMVEALRTRAPFASQRTPPFDESYEFVLDGRKIGLEVTPGNVEVLDGSPEDPVATLTLDCSSLMELILLGKTLDVAQAEGKLEVQGDAAAAERAISLFRIPGVEPIVELAADS